MDYSNILNCLLSDLKRAQPDDRKITKEELTTYAANMARRGYVPCAASLAALEKYLQGYGLWLSGDVGTGKTMFFKVLPVFQTSRNREMERVTLSMGGILDWTVEDLSAFLTANEGNELVLDDLGREPQFVEYGKRFEILPWIIEKRMGVTARTHFTTNFPKKYFDERYGYGLFDRMRSMAFHVRFEGESNRQLRPRIIFRAAAKPTAPAAPAGGKPEKPEKPEKRSESKTERKPERF